MINQICQLLSLVWIANGHILTAGNLTFVQGNAWKCVFLCYLKLKWVIRTLQPMIKIKLRTRLKIAEKVISISRTQNHYFAIWWCYGIHIIKLQMCNFLMSTQHFMFLSSLILWRNVLHNLSLLAHFFFWSKVTLHCKPSIWLLYGIIIW